MNQKKKISRKVISYVLALVMVFSTMTGIVPGMSITAYAAEATTLTAETTTWENGDYVVPTGGVTISGHITVNGTVNLTLTEGAALTANAGITLSDGATLNVSGKGTMAVNGSNNNTSPTVAGTGTLVLKSGTLTAKGGNGQSFGDVQMNKTGAAGGVAINGAVTVAGGTLNATGGNGGSIGDVSDNSKGGAGGIAINGALSINGGSMTASKGNSGSVGRGSRNSVGGVGGDCYGGTLTLGAGVKLYEGTEANEEKLLDGNDSASRVYESEKKASMYAYGPDITQGPDKTDLNTAITAAETLYNSIKDVADYSDIAATLSTAITAAKGVVESNTADQDAIDLATTAITTAKTKAEADKKDVDDTTEANRVSILIAALPAKEAVTKGDTTNVELAKAAYDDLTDDQKKKVSDANKQKLNDAVAAIEAIKKEEADTTAANAVSTQIAALPAKEEITKDDKNKVEAAKAAYDDLTDDQKKKVSEENKQKLNDAVAAIAAIEKEEADTTAANAVSTQIAALPAKEEITKDDKNKVEAAKAAYEDLTDDQKKKVSEKDKQKLDDAVAAIEAIEKDEADTVAAKTVSDTINALPASDKVATTDKAAIEAARKAYDALTADQKKKVSADTLKKLTDAETALTAAEKKAAEEEAAKKKEEADTKAANAVVETINKLPVSNKVATTDKAAIEAARKAYDALTADQKKKVSADTLKKLTDAEKALEAAEKKAAEDKAAAEKKAAEEKAAKELAAAKEEAQAAMNEQVTVTQKGKKFTVKWKKSSAADGYYVYAQYCGKKITKPAKTIAKNTTTKTTITKINGKKINQKRQFRVYVVPYKIIDGKKVTLGKSTVAHLVGAKSTKYSNVKKLTLTKKKYTVKVGKTAKIKAKVTLVNKNKKHIPKGHGAKFRYKSSDTSIATVDKNGKIKGIKKGTCTIYVYSINGLMKKAKVTIK